MNTKKINILFLLEKAKMNKQGTCPVKCRLTYLGKRKPFSTGLFINPDYWNSKKQKASPSNKESEYLNTQLSLIKQEINQVFLLLQVNNENFDVEDIYLQYKGESIKANKTLLEVFDIHNERVQKLLGIEYAKSTYDKFIECRKLITRFIKFQYKKGDFLLDKLTLKFLKDLDYYLKVEVGQQQSTINKHIQRVRKITNLAIAEGYLDRNPFMLYKPKRHNKRVVYLDEKELKDLESHSFAQNRLKEVRDMFVFCCYTGLAYAEMCNLSEEHIIKGFDGNLWIDMYRKKTNSKVTVPLLPKALEILNSFKLADTNRNKIFPEISNQKVNSFLKEIAQVVGIEKRLTHHIARKTFATTILLYNDVPMEIVSKLLGHSKMSITQESYGKIVQKKVSEHISILGKKLK